MFVENIVKSIKDNGTQNIFVLIFSLNRKEDFNTMKKK